MRRSSRSNVASNGWRSRRRPPLEAQVFQLKSHLASVTQKRAVGASFARDLGNSIIKFCEPLCVTCVRLNEHANCSKYCNGLRFCQAALKEASQRYRDYRLSHFCCDMHSSTPKPNGASAAASLGYRRLGRLSVGNGETLGQLGGMAIWYLYPDRRGAHMNLLGAASPARTIRISIGSY